MFDLTKSKLINPNQEVKYYTDNIPINLEVDHHSYDDENFKNNLGNYEYYWFKEDNQSSKSKNINYLNKTGPKIQLNNLSREDDGSNYYCLLVNTKDLSQQTYYWQQPIRYRPNDFMVYDAQIRVGTSNVNDGFNSNNTPIFLFQTNDELKMNIQPSISGEYSSNLKFQWYKSPSMNLIETNDLDLYTPVTTNNEGELSFDKLSLSNSGTYICKVWIEKVNPAGVLIKSEPFLTSPVVINIINNLTFENQEPKIQTKYNGDFQDIKLSEIRENSQIKITPQLQFNNLEEVITPNNFNSNKDIERIESQWFKLEDNSSEQEIKNSDDVYIENGVLNFKNIQKSDEGKYKSKIRIYFKNGGFKERTSSIFDLKLLSPHQINAVFEKQETWTNLYNGQNEFEIIVSASVIDTESKEPSLDTSLSYQWYYQQNNDWHEIQNLNSNTLKLNQKQIAGLENQKFKCLISSTTNSSKPIEITTDPISCINPQFDENDKLLDKSNQEVGTTVVWNGNTNILNAPNSSLGVEWTPEYHWQIKKPNQEEWVDVPSDNRENPVFLIRDISLNDEGTKVRCFATVKGIYPDSQKKFYKNLGESTLTINPPVPRTLTVENVKDMINNIQTITKTHNDINSLNDVVKKYLGLNDSNLKKITFIKSQDSSSFFKNADMSTSVWKIKIELQKDSFNPLLGVTPFLNLKLQDSNQTLIIENVELNTKNIKLNSKAINYQLVDDMFNNVKYFEELKEQIDIFNKQYYTEFLSNNNIYSQYVSSIQINEDNSVRTNSSAKYQLVLQAENGFVFDNSSSQSSTLTKDYQYEYVSVNESILSESSLNNLGQYLSDLYAKNTSIKLDNQYLKKFNLNFTNFNSEVQLSVVNPKNQKVHRHINSEITPSRAYMSPSVYLYEFKISNDKNVSFSQETLTQINTTIYNKTLEKIKQTNILDGAPNRYLTFDKFKDIVSLRYDNIDNCFYLSMDSRILTMELEDILYLKQITSLYDRKALIGKPGLAYQAIGANNMSNIFNYFYASATANHVLIMGDSETKYENLYITYEPNELVVNFQTNKYFVASNEIINELDSKKDELNIKLDHKENQKAFIFQNIEYGKRLLDKNALTESQPIFGNKKLISDENGKQAIALVQQKIDSQELTKSDFSLMFPNSTKKSIYTLNNKSIRQEILKIYGFNEIDCVDIFAQFDNNNLKFSKNVRLWVGMKVGNGFIATDTLNGTHHKLMNFGTSIQSDYQITYGEFFGYFKENILINTKYLKNDTDLGPNYTPNPTLSLFADLIEIKYNFSI